MSAGSRQTNRDRMPTVAAWIDELRLSLGPELSSGMRVLYAQEGEQTLGIPTKEEGVVPVIDWTQIDPKLRQKLSESSK